MDEADNFIHDKYGYCFYSMEPGQLPIVYNLFVEPPYRGKGHARRLVAYVMSEVRKSGYTGPIVVEASPREDSIPQVDLTAFYERMGLTVLPPDRD